MPSSSSSSATSRALTPADVVRARLRPAERGGPHKHVADLILRDGRTRTVRFGARGYQDYTLYHAKDPALALQKRSAYVARHREGERWRDPGTAGFWSRWLLWNLPTVAASARDITARFGFPVIRSR